MKEKEFTEVNMQPQKTIEETGLKDFTVEDLKPRDMVDNENPEVLGKNVFYRRNGSPSLLQADPINEIYPLGIEVEDDGPVWR